MPTGDARWTSAPKDVRLRQPTFAEALFGAVIGEFSGTSIGGTRLVGPPEAPQEFGPRRVQVAEVIEAELGDEAQAGLGAVGLGDGDIATFRQDRTCRSKTDGEPRNRQVEPGDLDPAQAFAGACVPGGVRAPLEYLGSWV